MQICADYQVNISRSKILYCCQYRNSDLLRDFFYDVTTRDVSYIKQFNYSRDDLIGDVTTPLQTNSSHRASDMAGDHCYFGSFFLYKYN